MDFQLASSVKGHGMTRLLLKYALQRYVVAGAVIRTAIQIHDVLQLHEGEKNDYIVREWCLRTPVLEPTKSRQRLSRIARGRVRVLLARSCTHTSHRSNQTLLYTTIKWYSGALGISANVGNGIMTQGISQTR